MLRPALLLLLSTHLAVAGSGDGNDAAPRQRLPLVAETVVEPGALNFHRGTYGTCINGQTFQIEAVVTFKGWQYATCFDGQKRLVVARRRLPDGVWERLAFDDYTIGHTDVHNVAVIGICPADGTLHLAFDHHGSPLHYRVSRAGAATAPEKTAWTAALFGPVTAELVKGRKLTGVTYPAFFPTPEGRLQLAYRIGGSGNGSSHLAHYDPDKGGWTLLGEFIGKIGDFRGSTTRNAYHNGFDYGTDGRLHTTWVWREGQDNARWGPSNCHDLQYAYSDDRGRTWRNNSGQQIGVTGQDPLRLDSPQITVQEAPWRWGMMNQLTQTLDHRGRLHVILWQNPPDAPAPASDKNAWRYFHYWRDEESHWHRQQLPFFGRKPSIVADKSDTLFLVFRKPADLEYHGTDPGGPLHIYTASAAQGWTNWQQMFVSEKSFVGEPRVDKSRWQQENVLSIYTQEAPAAPGQPSPLRMLDFRPTASRRPNILWLVGENMDHDLGCYGQKLVSTPNLDRLAAEGVRYTRVFSTSPSCAPSRSAFMVGMYQTTTDTHNMRSHRSDDFRLPPGVRPLTHRLRDAGYFTANIKTIGGRPVGTGKLDLNFVNEGPIFESADWSALKARQPFYAQVNSHEVEYDIYDRQSAGKPRVEWVGEREHPHLATEQNVTPPPYYPDHPVVRQEWARYLNSVSGLDRRIGWVLEQLRADGLEDDTVIIFFADNGRLEARGIHWCYDSGLRVPMIIRWPKNFPAPPDCKPGTVNDQVISLLDLTATTLALAGVARPPGMQSRNFLGAQADPSRRYAFSARDRIDETVMRIRTVRDARYRYIRNMLPGPTFTALNRYKEKCFLIVPLMRKLHVEGKLSGAPLALMAARAPDEELYDVEQDPHEINNLAGSKLAEHVEALTRLRAALNAWMVETDDRGRFPEPPALIAPFAKEMHDWFGTPALP